MYAALPRSDYYGDSAPRSRRRWTWTACRASPARRSNRGSRVHEADPRCGRRSALPLAARTSRRLPGEASGASLRDVPSAAT